MGMRIKINQSLLALLTFLSICYSKCGEASDAIKIQLPKKAQAYISSIDDGYPVPKEMIRHWLFGYGFDNKNPYNEEELSRVYQDLEEIAQIRFMQPLRKSKTPIAVLTAGAPGSGKTIVLENHWKNQEHQTNVAIAYNDPDARVLRYMEHTWAQDIKATHNTIDSRKNAYTKWRPASNAIAQILQAYILKHKVDFYFGTTSSSDKAKYLYKYLKDLGYYIKVLHVTAPDEVRIASIHKRDKEFVQTSDQDIVNKAIDLAKRINDTFCAYANEIIFYYRDQVEEKAKPVAIWKRISYGKETFQILDQDGFEAVKQIHNQKCLQMQTDSKCEVDSLLLENAIESSKT